VLYGVHWGAPETMNWQRLKQSARAWVDRIRRDERSPQGLKPDYEQIFMLELKLRPPKDSGNGAGLKTGRCEIGKASQEIQERTVSEGGRYKNKERQTQKGTMYRTPTGAWLRKRFLHKSRNGLTLEGVSYRIYKNKNSKMKNKKKE